MERNTEFSIYNLMKNYILLFIILSAVLASEKLRINLSQRIILSEGYGYELFCDNARGNVIYHVDGLPKGTKLEGNLIIVNPDAKGGNFVLRIKAVDDAGSIAEQIITLATTSINVEEQTIEEAGKAVAEGVATEERLADILSSYSSVSTTRSVTYENNRFPVEEFPTGGFDSYNPLPDEILGKSTDPDNSDRNIVTVDDVALRSASERHQNAVKGITNLLKLIDQARANKNQAKKDVEFYTKALNEVRSSQRKTQSAIVSVQNKIQQIKSARSALDDLISQVRQEIDDVIAENEELEAEKAQTLKFISIKEKKMNELLQQLKANNVELGKLIKQQNVQLEECQGIESALKEGKRQIEYLSDSLEQVIRDKRKAEAEVELKGKRVDDLRKQLAEAQKDLSNSELELADLTSERERIPPTIRSLSEALDEFEANLNVCNAKALSIGEKIGELKNEQNKEITREVESIEEEILFKRTQVSEIDATIASLVGPLSNLKSKLEQSIEDLDFLKDQMRVTEEDLRRVYILGNQVNTKVTHAKQNLGSAVTRFKKESKVVSDATLNLEKVRAEEALARLALEELIAKYSDALPYTIIPNGNGENTGFPLGNNAIGSALGQTRKKLKITSRNELTHYISEIYGEGISLQLGSISEIIPFSHGRSLLGGEIESCGVSDSSLAVIAGEIISVGENKFEIINESSEVYTVYIEKCTHLTATAEGYDLRIGSRTLVKGEKQSARSIIGVDVLCVQ